MRQSIIVKTTYDTQIADIAAKIDKKTLAIWACDCAERVLPYFEQKYPDDYRPRMAIEAGREWVKTGIFKMADIRRASLGSHAAARDVPEYTPARSAARAAGQAVATAHAKGHSVAAALYAATAIRNDENITNKDEAINKERQWQLDHLLELKTSCKLIPPPQNCPFWLKPTSRSST